MHVQAHTLLSMDEVRARLESIARLPMRQVNDGRRLVYQADRSPPKFYLPGVPFTLAPAAEVAVDSCSQGRSVVLRLMWGPLPAPFPRALTAAGLLLALVILAFTDRSAVDWAAAVLAALLPGMALWYQRVGERQLQARLGELLGGVGFQPRPY